MDCLFCQIISGAIPSEKIYEDDKMICIRDIDPQAPEHFLAIPKKHIVSLSTMNESDEESVAHTLLQIPKLCAQLKISNGYRVVINCGADGGQTVGHIHFHVLAKRYLAWPPG